jgi:hypothetical protein
MYPKQDLLFYSEPAPAAKVVAIIIVATARYLLAF